MPEFNAYPIAALGRPGNDDKMCFLNVRSTELPLKSYSAI